jgi:polyvinyl alcohol dehydrogenase (cytochrome)
MRTGCYFWDYAASAGVRTAITVARTGGRSIAFFGDRGRAYAIDAATGETVWKVTADDDSAAQVTGSPVLFEGRLYVPISTGDDSAAVDPKYECCKGRGAVVALDAGNGSVIWKTTQFRRPTRKAGTRSELGSLGLRALPSGRRRPWTGSAGLLYVGTGDNHSAPPTATSDAVLALSPMILAPSLVEIPAG